VKAFDYLSQAYMLDQRIRTKLHHLSSLRSLAQTMRALSSGDPVCRTRNVSSLEDAVIRILEQEQEMNREIDRLVALKREIMEVLEEVRDTNLRLILEKRYLCFESWPRIGEEMGHTDRWAQFRHKAALQAVQEILDRRQA